MFDLKELYARPDMILKQLKNTKLIFYYLLAMKTVSTQIF